MFYKNECTCHSNLTFLRADGFLALGTSRSFPRFFTGADMRDLTCSTPVLLCEPATLTSHNLQGNILPTFNNDGYDDDDSDTVLTYEIFI